MAKKGFLIAFALYFFVIQSFIIGALRGDVHFYTLGGINFLVLILILLGASVFSSDKNNKGEKKEVYPIVKEKIAQEKVIETPEKKEENVGGEEEKEIGVRRTRNEEPISESNIEYIKTKINRSKRRPLAEGAGIYRFLVFLLAILGFGGILYLFWDSLDFIAVVIGAFAMLIFLGVCFKAGNIRRKGLLKSVYFWVFLLVMLGGIIGIIYSNSSAVEKTKENISVFFDGIKGEEVVQEDINQQEQTQVEDFLYEITGRVDGFSLSGESIYDEESLSGVTTTGENLENNEAVEEPTASENAVSTINENQDLTAQVSMIEAIKHLISTYNIPLSTSTSQKFTYVAKSNENYPYMKTALEKKMIGTTTDPNMIVSCDVYMVMKGLAEGWNLAKTSDVKATYWTEAVKRDALNGCIKGAKLTYANL